MNIEIPDEYFNEEELENTPKRYQRFLKEWLVDSKDFKFTTFKNPGYDEMIIVKDIDTYSMCAHHLLPFTMKVHVGYLPNEKICGLSKIVRVVEMFSHKPQLQERLTQEIADYLFEKLGAKGVIITIFGEHLCMSLRGVRKPHHQTITTALKGVFRVDHSAKEEFMRLIR